MTPHASSNTAVSSDEEYTPAPWCRRVLVVEDDSSMRTAYERYLRRLGYTVESARTLAETSRKLSGFNPDAVILDLMLPDGNSLELISGLRAADPDIALVVITAVDDVRMAVQAMQRGADHYVVKPVRLDELKVVIEKAAEIHGLRRTRTIFRRQIKSQEVFFGRSLRWQELARQVELAAAGDSVVLLTGETGVGKGVLARWIHDHSRRAAGHFVELNCGALHGELLASELFGHVRGAFTSAVKDQPGLVEVASEGTLFLDEIGSMDLNLQPQLLNVIEEKRYRRVGDTRTRLSDFRLICATNRDLEELVRSGKFREDLFYRINVFPIPVPPLRQMKEDLPALFQHLLASLGHPEARISPAAMKRLCRYDWPGNIREAKNVLERALILSGGATIGVEHLPELPGTGKGAGVRAGRSLKALEMEHIKRVIKECDGNISAAARVLGVSRATLYRRLKAIGR